MTWARTGSLIASLCISPLLASVSNAQLFQGATTAQRSGDAELQGSPTVEVVQRYAAEHNPAIRAALNAWEAAQKKIIIDRSYENPMVSYSPDTQNMVQTVSGMETNAVGVSQAIPFPGKLTLRGQIAAREADAVHENLRAVIQETERRVSTSYVAYYLADRTLEVVEETTQLARQFETVAEAKYQVGKVPEQDVIQAQVEVSQLSVQKVDLLKARNTALGNLNALLDREPRSPIGRPQELAANSISAPLERFVEEARAARPEIKAEERMVEARETSVNLAKMGYLPDFNIGGDYIGIDGMSGLPGNPANGHDVWMVSMGFSVPIWLDRVKAQVDQAKAEFSEEKSAKRNVEDTVADEVQGAYERLEAATRNESIYRTTLMPQTAERVAAARAGYQTGIVDFLTLIDSLRAYEDVRMRHYETIEQYQVSAADLARAVGQPIEGLLK
jgi:outer membrane protein TolC